MVDGRVARATDQVTRFGGFFDSVMDRYSDLALYMGLVVYYTLIGRPFYMVLAAVAMAERGSASSSAISPKKFPDWIKPRVSCWPPRPDFEIFTDPSPTRWAAA